MMLGALKKGKNVQGYIDKGQYEIHNLIKRHNELAIEMVRRGWKHNSPISKDNEKLLYKAGHVDVIDNMKQLMSRCKDCRERILKENIFRPVNEIFEDVKW
jgi:hypothetical protein